MNRKLEREVGSGAFARFIDEETIPQANGEQEVLQINWHLVIDRVFCNKALFYNLDTFSSWAYYHIFTGVSKTTVEATPIIVPNRGLLFMIDAEHYSGRLGTLLLDAIPVEQWPKEAIEAVFHNYMYSREAARLIWEDDKIEYAHKLELLRKLR